MNIRLIWVKPEVHILPKLNFFLSTKLKIRFRIIRTCVRFGIFNCVVELWEWRRSPTDRHHRYHTAVCRECHPVDPVHRSCLPWQERVGTASSRTSHWKSMYIGIFVIHEVFFKSFFFGENNQLLTLDLTLLIVGEEIGRSLFHPWVCQTRMFVLLWTKVFYL